MANSTDYRIKITALNQTQAVFRELNNALERVGESTGLAKLAGAAQFASQKFSALAGAVSGLAGVGAGFGLFQIARGASDFGTQLYLASQKTGIAADALAKLHYAGQTANIDIAQLDKAMFRFNLTIQRAAAGEGKDAIEMFRGLHIPLRDAKGHIRDISSVFADLSDAAAKHPRLMQLIAGTAFGGRMGGDMIPLMRKSREELKQLYDTFEQSYGKITPQILRNAYEAHEAWERFDIAAAGLKFTLGSMLAPTLERTAIGLTKLLITAREFITTDLPGFISKHFVISKSDVDALVGSFDGLGQAFSDVWTQAQPLRDALQSFGDAFDPFSQMKYWPDWLKNATPAARDFWRALHGDVGASMRTGARAIGVGKGLLRGTAELEGGLLGKHPLNASRFRAAWAGKKISALDAGGISIKADLSSNVWDVSKWLDFSSGGTSSRAATQSAARRLVDKYAAKWAGRAGMSVASFRALAEATAMQESSMGLHLKSPTGVRGIMMVTRALAHSYGGNRDVPEQNVDIGLHYLADLIRRKGNVYDALMSYNGGSDPLYASKILDRANRAAVDVNVKIAGLPRGSTAHTVRTADARHLGDVSMGVSWAMP